MPMEKHDTCLGIVPRGRKEWKLTFQKHISDMLRKKAQRMGDP
jgi:hypothetical protein